MADPAPDKPPSSGGNVFTRKVGPLPMWTWMGIVLLIALLYYFFKQKSSKTTTDAGASTNADTTDSSLVPQFVNQTYVQGAPPPAPPMKSPHVPVKPGPTQTVNAYSWTDTGQKWSAAELAKHLGISIAALSATNAAGKKALANPNEPIAKGAKFDYTKEPKVITKPET